MAIMIERYDYAISPEMASQGVQGAFSRGFARYRKVDEPPIIMEGEDASSFGFQYEVPSGAQPHRTGKI